MSDVIHLGLWDVAGAGALVLLAGIVSISLRLRLEKDLAVGVVRSTVQLFLLGYALRWVFANVAIGFTLAALVLMTLAAARAGIQRSGWRIQAGFPGAFVTLILTSGLTALFASAVLVRAEPWYDPRYVLPMLGMLLGNGLTGISLCLDSLVSSFADGREQIELDLALGATRSEASRDPIRRAVKRGIIPIINAMMVVGIVSIPGMMTGQILAGAPPIEAVKYQLLILFLIAASTSLGSVGVAWFASRRLVDASHRVRPDRFERRA